MKRIALVITAGIALGACSGTLSAIEDDEIIGSIRYDQIPCPDLAAQRDALAASHGLPRDVKRVPSAERTPGVGLLSPDPLTGEQRQRRQAAAMIDAMNRSMERRSCEGV